MNDEIRKAFEADKSKFIFDIEHEDDCKYKNRKNIAVSDCLCYCHERAIFKAGYEHQQKRVERLVDLLRAVQECSWPDRPTLLPRELRYAVSEILKEETKWIS